MHHPRIPNTIKFVPLALALGLAVTAPVQADPAGPACWVLNATTGEWEQDGSADRTLGSEHDSANGTSHANANAYGSGNNASSDGSSAIGIANIARGNHSSAMGRGNTASS